MNMKKLTIFISLALMVSVVSAQSNLDSLHTVINNELNQSTTDLEGKIRSLSTDLSASTTQKQTELDNLRTETNTQLTTSLSTLKEELRDELSKEVSSLQSSITKERDRVKSLNDTIASLRAQLSGGLTMIDSEVDDLSTTLNATNSELGAIKVAGEQSDKSTHEHLTYLFAAICILLLLVILVYWLTHKKHGSVRSELGDAKADLKEQINTANTDFAEKLAKTLSELPKPVEGGDNAGSPADNQGLILDFAQQIASMENNIWHLPEDDKVRKRIEKATKKMRDTFKSLGYEMPNLMDTEVSDNQIIEIKNRAEDLSLQTGKVIICRVAKPLILLNGKMVQKPVVDIKENSEN
jgi:F0F1-type ATP synthase membrane subunit b/b'